MAEKLSEYFGKNTFNEQTMHERLPKKVYDALQKTIANGEDLDPAVAEVVANAMKDWAIEHGATHYSHWFQPLTGITAEKHDSFLSPAEGGRVLMEFSGKELIKGEPDASSFPSGGLRATFEARGYTAWDCTSPAFLREDAGGVTLCIPTAFCSYTGEALDKKTPLLRSMEAISDQTVRVLKLFGRDDVKRVNCCVGAEQEYFIIDKEKYLKRDDLIYTGRTLFGAMPPKGQEMDDHYFGTIKERIAAFMKELNVELWKLGIYAKTQHNEAAPSQHELASVYTTVNIATDHNQLIMETMKRIARRHGLVCILHEKPFAGLSGSGKHNNWSLSTDKGENLFKPGSNPHEDLRFLLFLAAVMEAVDENAELLRFSASNVGNELRLGADEAPPAIISIFLGEQLEDILSQYAKYGEATSSIKGERLNTGVHTLPTIKRDATDRNRTSPFAFTGNKFEFRSVASSLSIAGANTVLNTILADVLSRMANELEAKLGVTAADEACCISSKYSRAEFEKAVKELIRDTVIKHQRIVFSGNGYSDEWKEEAKRRGLPNLESIVDSIPSLTSPHTVEMCTRLNVLSETELTSRAEINYEIYSKAENIEAKTMTEMANRLYFPAVNKYITQLSQTVISLLNAGMQADIQSSMLSECNALFRDAKKADEKLQAVISEVRNIADAREKAQYVRKNLVPAMEALRKPVDKLETIVDASLWPVPTYGDLLFEV